MILSHRIACSLLRKQEALASSSGSGPEAPIVSMLRRGTSVRQYPTLGLLQRVTGADDQWRIALPPEIVNREDAAAEQPTLSEVSQLQIGAGIARSTGTTPEAPVAVKRANEVAPAKVVTMGALAAVQSNNKSAASRAKLQIGKIKQKEGEHVAESRTSMGGLSVMTDHPDGKKLLPFPETEAGTFRRMPSSTLVLTSPSGQVTRSSTRKDLTRLTRSTPLLPSAAAKVGVPPPGSTTGLISTRTGTDRHEVINGFDSSGRQTALQRVMTAPVGPGPIPGPTMAVAGIRDAMSALAEPLAAPLGAAAAGSVALTTSHGATSGGHLPNVGQVSNPMIALQQRAVPAPQPPVMTSALRNSVLTGTSPFESTAPRSPVELLGGQASEAEKAFVVNLTGDVVIDGRRLGRITASSQAREASLPARGPSRVNLRAVPIYSGTQIPG